MVLGVFSCCAIGGTGGALRQCSVVPPWKAEWGDAAQDLQCTTARSPSGSSLLPDRRLFRVFTREERLGLGIEEGAPSYACSSHVFIRYLFEDSNPNRAFISLLPSSAKRVYVCSTRKEPEVLLSLQAPGEPTLCFYLRTYPCGAKMTMTVAMIT